MISTFPTQLPHIEDLFKRKDQELSSLIGKLQINDVKDDNVFEATTRRIKNQILLTKVEFKDPVIKGHRQEQKIVRPNYNRVFGGTETVQIVTVDFNFSGSPELFMFSPNGLSFSSSDTGVYQPRFNNTIAIEVEVPQLDKSEVLKRANEMMKTTFSVIQQINPQAERWSLNKAQSIDSALKQKREELISFYG